MGSFKKLILTISLGIALITGVVLASSYLASQAEDANFNINGSTLEAYTGQEADITVPSSVLTIGKNAFSGNTTLETVVIPDGVTKIENGAFSGCTNLKSIIIPDSVGSIGDSAFDGCSALSSVSLGSGCNRIGSGAFSGCDSLSAIELSSDNTSFVCQDHALYNANKTTLVQYFAGAGVSQFKIPDTVQEIKEYAFWGCDDLEDVFLSAGLQKIGQYAFANCSGLETATIVEPTNEIAMGAFSNCPNLEEVVLPISITNIHSSAFTGCSPDLYFVCQEGSYAANYASENGFQSGTVDKNQVQYMAQTVQEASDSDGNLTMTESVSGNNENSNAGQDSAEANNSADDNTDQNGNISNSENGEAVDDTAKTNSSSFSGYVDGDEVGNGVVVSDRVFVMMDNIPSKDGGSSDNSSSNDGASDQGAADPYTVSGYSYYQDKNLTKLPDLTGKTSIGELAFARSGLQSAEIPDGIESIGYGAFYHCDDLENVTIPDSVTSIADYAFSHTPWLDNWYEQTAATGDDYFLIVGDGVLIAYKGQMETITLPSNVKYISNNVFRNHTELQKAELPNGLISIGEYAFAGCTSLNSITECDAVTNAPATAFESCDL